MPRHPQGTLNDSCAPGSASKNVSAARAAQVILVFGHINSKLAQAISEEENSGASSMTWLSLEFNLLKLSSILQECTRSAGTLPVFFDFHIFVRDVWMNWSPSAVRHRSWKTIVLLTKQVHAVGSNSLILTLTSKIMIIVFLAICNSRICCTLVEFYTTFMHFSWAWQVISFTQKSVFLPNKYSSNQVWISSSILLLVIEKFLAPSVGFTWTPKVYCSSIYNVCFIGIQA